MLTIYLKSLIESNRADDCFIGFDTSKGNLLDKKIKLFGNLLLIHYFIKFQNKSDGFQLPGSFNDCLFQLQAIELARNVLALNDANSIEFDPKTINPIIIDMPEHNMGRMGATMRLGLKKTFVVKTSILKSSCRAKSFNLNQDRK
uniref:Uncharacterized protein n=1 Tax=Tetranychus urticae TaxID=32264 RepID=T1KFM2_TETUR